MPPGVLKKTASPRVWFEVAGLEPFEIEVMYLAPEDLKNINTACTKNVIDKVTHTVVPQVDNEAVSKLMIKTMVKGWRGLTIDVLKQVMPLDKDSERVISEDMGGELKFSDDDLDFIAENTYASSFMSAVLKLSMDMQAFRKAELSIVAKNSVG